MAQGAVLLIEDEMRMASAMREVLRLEGYSVLVAQSGAEGLSKFGGQGAIDVAIVDWVLPDMGGDVLVDELLALDPNVRIIFCTGHTLPEDVREKLRPRVRGFLYKPFPGAELLAMVRQALE